MPLGRMGQLRNDDTRQRCCWAGIVLLKNEDVGGGKQLLPLNAGALKKVVVMGPHARATEVLMGNYYGNPARRITSPLEALQVPRAEADAPGCLAHCGGVTPPSPKYPSGTKAPRKSECNRK